MALTKKRKAFIQHYLKCWNATEAARRAGYKHPNVYGPTLVNLSEIEEVIQERIDQLVMSADEALVRLSKIARADYSQYIRDYGPVKTIDVEAMIDDGLGDLVREVYQTSEGPRVKLADPDWATELVLKHQTKGPSGAKDDPLHMVINWDNDADG